MARHAIALLALVALSGLFSSADARGLLTLKHAPEAPEAPAQQPAGADAAVDAAVRRVLAEMGLPALRLQDAPPQGALPAARQLAEMAVNQQAAQQVANQQAVATTFGLRNTAYVGLGGWNSAHALYAPGTLYTTGGMGYYDAVAAQNRYDTL
ncbi:hypothetical protein Rsub_11992 [Raphidocelis subcapitata]|uniref:Uncharacterized protein n=1 Tax=Raphidocelis subcapitata TaxID=307507 RepID=A0A2V0PNP5_9CHLO|nr:hypothetical protein Rsub_11992 [Raphidocelis subcapitata]|eukprot:GBF99047.1 hypothetical protein Rsub_11992 [Raphidocelis subcapitata]